MKKLLLILMVLCLCLTSVIAFGDDYEDEHDYAFFLGEDQTPYDLFVITKLNYGEDHKVTSVTGHYERVTTTEDLEDIPEEAPDSERTYTLAADFSANMLSNIFEEFDLVPVTDLYEWYIDAYIGRDGYDGHELVFTCDMTDEQLEEEWADFWFVTTQIVLNDQEEISYMQYAYVPWA